MVKILSIFAVAVSLSACNAVPQKTAMNPQGLTNEELLKLQQIRLDKLEREMDRKENELRYQHLKELQAVQAQQKAASVINTNCKFLCF